MGFHERVVSGVRMHSRYFRPEGVSQDSSLGIVDYIYTFPGQFEQKWICRYRGSYGTAQEAVNWGFSGVMLGGPGVRWDLRKNEPYEVYSELNFRGIIGKTEDCYDRHLPRFEEMRQSLSIIYKYQCLNKRPKGSVKIDDAKISPPLRSKVKHNMESLVHHF